MIDYDYNYNFLEKTMLFKGMKEPEIKNLIVCTSAHPKSFKKDEIIYRAGDIAGNVGLVLTGSVNMVVNYYWGNSNIFSHIAPGQIFAETYTAIPGKELLTDVVAAEDTDIMFMSMNCITDSCSKGCKWHNRMVHNLVQIMAQKNLDMSMRMMHTASRTIRDRLLSYFSEQASINNGPEFSIPFSRQQLADYLGVERSALSNELSKMQKEGLISFHKNDFKLLQTTVKDM